jgi:hypothetical protein
MGLPQVEIDPHIYLRGVAQQMYEALPRGMSFFILAWPDDDGQSINCVNAQRPEAISRLKECAKILEKRDHLGIPKELTR